MQLNLRVTVAILQNTYLLGIPFSINIINHCKFATRRRRSHGSHVVSTVPVLLPLLLLEGSWNAESYSMHMFVHELRDLVHSGQLSPIAIVEACLARIAESNRPRPTRFCTSWQSPRWQRLPSRQSSRQLASRCRRSRVPRSGSKTWTMLPACRPPTGTGSSAARHSSSRTRQHPGFYYVEEGQLSSRCPSS